MILLSRPGNWKNDCTKVHRIFTNKYGHLKLYTSASVDNKKAIALYKKFGFEKKYVFEYEAEGRKHKDVRMIAQL